MLELYATGAFLKILPSKDHPATATTTTTTITTIAAAAAAIMATKQITPAINKSPNTETGDHPDKGEERWTQVTRRRKKKEKPTTTIEPTEKQTTVTTVTTAKEKQPSSSSPITKKNKDNTEAIDTTINLKRRRDSGDSTKEGEKKHIKKPTPKTAKEPETGSQLPTPP